MSNDNGDNENSSTNDNGGSTEGENEEGRQGYELYHKDYPDWDDKSDQTFAMLTIKGSQAIMRKAEVYNAVYLENMTLLRKRGKEHAAVENAKKVDIENLDSKIQCNTEALVALDKGDHNTWRQLGWISINILLKGIRL